MAVGLVQIPSDDGTLRADCCTRWLQTHLGDGAEMAFGRGVPVRINIDGVVGAGLHAGLAADALAVIDDYSVSHLRTLSMETDVSDSADRAATHQRSTLPSKTSLPVFGKENE